MQEIPKEHKLFKESFEGTIRETTVAGKPMLPRVTLVSTVFEFYDRTRPWYDVLHWLGKAAEAGMDEEKRQELREKDEEAFSKAWIGGKVAFQADKKGRHAVVYIKPGTSKEEIAQHARNIALLMITGKRGYRDPNGAKAGKKGF